MKKQVNIPFMRILGLSVAIYFISARSLSYQEIYIYQFSEIAKSESARTGIPASIKLAQGLFESSAGKSGLAIQANNHFGIKCINDWTGLTYFYKDDDLDSTGTLMHSCFRQYNNPEESYIDHSSFLTQRSRYKGLFSIDKKDYISWAVGLKNCGYATDPNYSNKLIKTIEKYELYELDNGTKMFDFTQSVNPVQIEQPKSEINVKSAKKIKKNRHKSKKNKSLHIFAPAKVIGVEVNQSQTNRRMLIE